MINEIMVKFQEKKKVAFHHRNSIGSIKPGKRLQTVLFPLE
jgi:hypothetical protein